MSDVTSFEVTGDWRHIIDDGMVDTDDLPDEVPLTGKVEFKPVFPSVAIAGAPATAYTLGPVTALVAGGVLTDLQGRPGVKLAGTIGDHKVRWTATTTLRFHEQKVPYPSVNFELDQDVRLTGIIAQVGPSLQPIVIDPRIEALAARLADVDQVIGDAEQIVTDAAQSVIDAKAQADRAVGLAAAQDTAIADRVTDTTSATHAAFKAVGNATYAPVDNVRIIDTAYASLTDALAATPAGGTLEVRGEWTRTLPLLVDKKITLDFRGGQITQTNDSDIIVLQASGIEVNSPVLVGPGATTNGVGSGIRAVGTVASPLNDLRIRSPRITGVRYTGIRLDYANRHVVENVNITDVGYAGVASLSSDSGTVRGGTIKNVLQPGAFVNSYGVMYSRDSSKTLAQSPHSTNFTVQDVTVDGVTKWEGIDTHGGQGGRILNCTVLRTRYPIRAVSCSNDSGEGPVGGWAPHNILVMGCFVDGAGLEGVEQGITISGAYNSATSFLQERAAGCALINNTIRRCGIPGAAAMSGIRGYATDGLIVSGNQVQECTSRGIVLDFENKNALVVSNVFVDTWGPSGVPTAIYLQGNDNSVTIHGNRGVRGSLQAPLVNERGVWNNRATNIITLGVNDFDSFPTPLSDVYDSSAHRLHARKTGFYGVSPVARQTVTAAATDAATTQALVNDLRAKLIAVGLIA